MEKDLQPTDCACENRGYSPCCLDIMVESRCLNCEEEIAQCDYVCPPCDSGRCEDCFCCPKGDKVTW